MFKKWKRICDWLQIDIKVDWYKENMSAFVYREKYRESSHSTHLIKKNKQKTIACIVLSKDIVACITVDPVIKRGGLGSS